MTDTTIHPMVIDLTDADDDMPDWVQDYVRAVTADALAQAGVDYPQLAPRLHHDMPVYAAELFLIQPSTYGLVLTMVQPDGTAVALHVPPHLLATMGERFKMSTDVSQRLFESGTRRSCEFTDLEDVEAMVRTALADAAMGDPQGSA